MAGLEDTFPEIIIKEDGSYQIKPKPGIENGRRVNINQVVRVFTLGFLGEPSHEDIVRALTAEAGLRGIKLPLSPAFISADNEIYLNRKKSVGITLVNYY